MNDIWLYSAFAVGALFALVVLFVAGLFLFNKKEKQQSTALPMRASQQVKDEEVVSAFTNETFDATQKGSLSGRKGQRLDSGKPVFDNDDDDFSITSGRD